MNKDFMLKEDNLEKQLQKLQESRNKYAKLLERDNLIRIMADNYDYSNIREFSSESLEESSINHVRTR